MGESVGTLTATVGVLVGRLVCVFVGVFVGVLVGVFVGVFVGVVIGAVARKSPDCDVVTLLPEVKSAAMQVPLGQKKSWIWEGVRPAAGPTKAPS